MKVTHITSELAVKSEVLTKWLYHSTKLYPDTISLVGHNTAVIVNNTLGNNPLVVNKSLGNNPPSC